MKILPALFVAALAASPLLSGCSSGPSGGASITPSNRLAVTLTMAQTIDPNFYYGVAFDDIVNDGRGPAAIEGGSGFLNKVMGGSWRVLVLFHQNLTAPVIYYRADPTADGSEIQVLGTGLLFNAPRVTANSISFTLNLDAKLNNNDYFFTHTAGATPTLGVDRFQANFVATNTVLPADPNNTLTKPVDAYENQSLSVPFELLVSSTRSGSINDPQGDKRPNVSSIYSDVNFGRIDVRQFDFTVTRTD